MSGSVSPLRAAEKREREWPCDGVGKLYQILYFFNVIQLQAVTIFPSICG